MLLMWAYGYSHHPDSEWRATLLSKIFLLSWAISLSAFSAAKVFKEKGKPVEVHYDDGRKAVLVIDREPVLIAEAPFGIYESTCNTNTKPVCNYKSSVLLDRIQVQWSVHPDEKQIGKPVILKLSDGTFTAAFDFAFKFAGSKYAGDPTVEVFPDDELTCDRYDWLPGGKTEAPSKLVVPRWDCELMQNNPETGLSENRIIGGAIDLLLEKSEKGNLTVKSAKAFAGLPVLFQGDVIALVLNDGEEFCHISLKPNFGKFGKVISEYLAAIKDGYQPVIYENEEVLTYTLSAALTTTSFLKNPNLLESK